MDEYILASRTSVNGLDGAAPNLGRWERDSRIFRRCFLAVRYCAFRANPHLAAIIHVFGPKLCRSSLDPGQTRGEELAVSALSEMKPSPLDSEAIEPSHAPWESTSGQASPGQPTGDIRWPEPWRASPPNRDPRDQNQDSVLESRIRPGSAPKVPPRPAGRVTSAP